MIISNKENIFRIIMFDMSDDKKITYIKRNFHDITI